MKINFSKTKDPLSTQHVEGLLLYLKKEGTELFLHQTTPVVTLTMCDKETAPGLFMHQAAQTLQLNF